MDAHLMVLGKLRQMIASGELKPGDRVVEIPTAEKFGVSRQPVRMALQILSQEGLLDRSPGRGFSVRKIAAGEVMGAIEVRGVLEGLAARQAAENGLSAPQFLILQKCIEDCELLFSAELFGLEQVAQYHERNVVFHDTVVAAADNPAIPIALSKINSLPFASVRSLVTDIQNGDREKKRLYYAHMQHKALFLALRYRQGARAEALMKEHANAPVLFTDLIEGFAVNADSIRVIR